MARSERDREDILLEARALVERAEFSTGGSGEEVIVIGFRPDGGASFYLQPDFVLHFNPRGELRRAYWREQLLKADARRLIAMQRVRDAHATTLLSRPCPEADAAAFCGEALARLQSVAAELASERLRCTRQVPDGADVRARISNWLRQHGERIMIAERPHAGG